MQKKLLIVDDEARIRMLLEQTLEELEEEGVGLLQADNGEEAIAIIREEHPQLIFLDFNMPRMNGVSVCQIVRQELGLSEVYIVLLTGKGQDADRQEGLEAGANRYLTKPFDPTEVLSLAEEVLGF